MIACLFCQAENESGRRHCQKCSALLPQPAQALPPRSLVNLKDTVSAPSPPKDRYANPLMHNLSWSAHEWLSEEGSREEFVEVYEQVRRRYERFQKDWSEVETALEAIRESLPERAEQISYLAGRGLLLFEEGVRRVDRALDEDPPEPDLMEGIRAILDGSDHLTLCLQLCQEP